MAMHFIKKSESPTRDGVTATSIDLVKTKLKLSAPILTIRRYSTKRVFDDNIHGIIEVN